MTKEEAIKLVKRIKGAMVYTEEEKEALETPIPELCESESEDEKFRKYILAVCKECVEANDKGLELSMSTTKKLLAYLENQKEQQPTEYIKRNSKEWYALLSEQYDKGYWNGKAEQKLKKPRVKIKGKGHFGEWNHGDTGVVDGYCQGAYSVPYAVVILDKNFKFVMVKLEQLEQIG